MLRSYIGNFSIEYETTTFERFEFLTGEHILKPKAHLCVSVSL